MKIKGVKEKIEIKKSIYRKQFCQDNKIIFWKKVWRYLKKHEIHIYNNSIKVHFNYKTRNSINTNEGINLD
jgi:hypothetical protein